jgi:DNA-directed RNA polymerase subunit RPC12/RpoP
MPPLTMGRNARRRAREHEEKRPQGLTPEEEKQGEVRDRCPRCGSNRLVSVQSMLGMPPEAPGVDVVCLNCDWHGKQEPAYWG